MSLPNAFAELLANQEQASGIDQQIVAELLNDENLDTKTELQHPLKWCALNTLDEYLGSKELFISQSILHNFIEKAKKYLISKDRKGRSEYIEALKSVREVQQQELIQKIGSMKTE